MLLPEHEHQPGGLAVEGRRDIEQGVLHDFFDAVVRDGGLVRQGVDRVAVFEGVEQSRCRSGGGHGGVGGIEGAGVDRLLQNRGLVCEERSLECFLGKIASDRRGKGALYEVRGHVLGGWIVEGKGQGEQKNC